MHTTRRPLAPGGYGMTLADMRSCRECGADISHRWPTAIRCLHCARYPWRKKHQGAPRSCRECGADISNRGNRAIFCKRHGSVKNQQRRCCEKRAAKRKAEKAPVICLDCPADISNRRRALRCVKCAKIKGRIYWQRANARRAAKRAKLRRDLEDSIYF